MRIVFANLWCLNPCVCRAVDAFARHRPDLIAVAELAPGKLDRVAARLPTHPHLLVVPTDRRGSLVLFSRWPISRAEEVRCGACHNRPYGMARVEASFPCTVLLAHTTAPFTPAMARRRNTQIECLAAAAANANGPLVLLGDLNADHSSVPLRGLGTTGGLLSPRHGPHHHRTWPSFLPRYTYDHVLHSADLVADEFHTLPACGSDHLPLFAVFRRAD